VCRDGIDHPEHHDRLVDDHELERELLDETRLLARLEEPADALGERRALEGRVLVEAPGTCAGA
jgi:hypothetical protein